MKNLIILFFTMFFAGSLSAQQTSEAAKRALEREIKVSGNYLYGEAVSNTKDEAVKMARSALLSEIHKEALNHSEWQFAKSIQAKDVEYNTDMIDLMRGNKFRVIAYVKKNNIQAVFGNSKIPNINMEDKKAKQKETQSVIKEETETQATPAPQPTQVQPKVEKTNLSVLVTPKDADDLPVKDADGLLEQILNAPSYDKVLKILNANKRIGKAVYGKMDKLTAPEKSYIVVYKSTGEIVAILDKGNNINRKDLLSGEVKGKEIIEQNQVIWFQLF